MGRRVCPKSFPVSPQSYYFMELFGRTHGGEAGTDLTHLPQSGGILEQPNIFFHASDIIADVKARHYIKKLKATKDAGSD